MIYRFSGRKAHAQLASPARLTLYGLGRKNLKKTTNFWARKGPKSEEQIYKNLNLMK